MTTYEIESDSNDVFQKKLDTIKAELSVIKLVRTTTRNHNKYGDFEF